MDSDIRKRLAAARKHLSSTAPDEHPIADEKRPRRRYVGRKRLFTLIGIGVILIVILLVVIIIRKDSPPENPIVPQSIAKSAPFPVYYPDPKKIPPGYTLDQASFSATNQAVVYSLIYGTDKRIVFTVQSKPSDSDLQTFYSNSIPLRNEFPTSSGPAVISALNGQTFASLPTSDNAWLIITAPNDIDPEAFKSVLSAIRRD